MSTREILINPSKIYLVKKYDPSTRIYKPEIIKRKTFFGKYITEQTDRYVDEYGYRYKKTDIMRNDVCIRHEHEKIIVTSLEYFIYFYFDPKSDYPTFGVPYKSLEDRDKAFYEIEMAMIKGATSHYFKVDGNFTTTYKDHNGNYIAL